MMDSEKVWQQFISNRKRGLEILYDHYYERIMSFCLGRLNHLDLAEDAVSEIFLKVYNYKHLEKIENHESWLFTIASNYCKSYFIKSSRRKRILTEAVLPSKNFSYFLNDLSIDIRNLEKEIELNLDEMGQKIWKLSLEGYTNEEISQKTCLNKKTVANKKSIIRKKIENIFKNHFNKGTQ